MQRLTRLAGALAVLAAAGLAASCARAPRRVAPNLAPVIFTPASAPTPTGLPRPARIFDDPQEPADDGAAF